jgi:hypothetical protein
LSGGSKDKTRENTSEIALLQMKRIQQLEHLYHQGARKRKKLKDLLSRFELYKAWLFSKANTGSDYALKELWNLHGFLRSAEILGNTLYSPMLEDTFSPAYPDSKYAYEVAEDGTVIYLFKERQVIKDQGNRIVVLSKDQSEIKTAIRLARLRFGRKMRVKGSREFIKQFKMSARAIGVDPDTQIEFTERE